MIHLAPMLAALFLSASPATGNTVAASPLDLIRLEAQDARLAAIRAEYERRRDLASPGARDQARLAAWCESAGLEAEAMAHRIVASRLVPDDVDLHRRLGRRLHRGTWKTEAEIAAESAEAKAQAAADDRWAPKLERWRDDLLDPNRRAGAIRGLDEVRDARAVRAIRWSFGDDRPWDQGWAVRLLGRIDAPRSTQELAKIAVFGLDAPVRTNALDRLAGRDPRTFVGLLINWLREPIRFQAEGPDDAGTRAILRVEGDGAIVERAYEPFLANRAGRPARGDDRSGPFRTGFEPADSQTLERAKRAVAERERRDVRTLERINATIERTNARAKQALVRATGEDFGTSQRDWTIWWTAELGYAYQSPPAQSPKPYVSESVPIPIAAPTPPAPPPFNPPLVQSRPAHHSCFAAGTSVLSRTGPKAIETLRVGDQVLSQDPRTGSIAFQPILAIFHNRPTPTLRVDLGGESILATPIHRFWVAGRGWAMARDLKAGEPIRALDGVVSVEAVVGDAIRPVYNLEVAEGHNFFVGAGRYLVHDNSLVAPTDRAFDRPGAGEVVSAVKSGR